MTSRGKFLTEMLLKKQQELLDNETKTNEMERTPIEEERQKVKRDEEIRTKRYRKGVKRIAACQSKNN
jgi:hypothetical protein